MFLAQYFQKFKSISDSRAFQHEQLREHAVLKARLLWLPSRTGCVRNRSANNLQWKNLDLC